jgi:hypothetical protein
MLHWKHWQAVPTRTGTHESRSDPRLPIATRVACGHVGQGGEKLYVDYLKQAQTSRSYLTACASLPYDDWKVKYQR